MTHSHRRVSRLFLIPALLIALSGCAEFYAAKSASTSYAAQVADESLKTNVWAMCNATSFGAIRRLFRSPLELAAFVQFCQQLQQ